MKGGERLKIGIIDADLLGRVKHRFPNLVCEKISGYYKARGGSVQLLSNYDDVGLFDKVFVSKVFTDTPFPEEILHRSNVEFGGTGFYFDKAPNLPDEIEHAFPDYNLYNHLIDPKKTEFKEYTDYSIGYLTRGCFRKCGFCVNQKYNHVFAASQLAEFYDPNRKKICLLDDNFFGFPNWKPLLNELIQTGKPFKFKQGLDERLLTDEKCELLFSAKYDGDYTFAFDNVFEYDLIESKLKMIRRHTDTVNLKFYVLVGFESVEISDIVNAFVRIELLMKYRCLPYVMRYQNKNETPWQESEFRGIYVTLARWCNQPSFFKKKSFREYCYFAGGAPVRYLTEFESKHPDVSQKYFDMKWGERV